MTEPRDRITIPVYTTDRLAPGMTVVVGGIGTFKIKDVISGTNFTIRPLHWYEKLWSWWNRQPQDATTYLSR